MYLICGRDHIFLIILETFELCSGGQKILIYSIKYAKNQDTGTSRNIRTRFVLNYIGIIAMTTFVENWQLIAGNSVATGLSQATPAFRASVCVVTHI